MRCPDATCPVAGRFGAFASEICFAAADTALELIVQEDDFLRGASQAMRRALTQSDGPVGNEAFAAHMASTVTGWTADAAAPWAEALRQVEQAFHAWKVPLPPAVWLIRTDGRDMFSTPYTRGQAVYLPQGIEDDKAMLLAHELLHVASRHCPPWAERLYGVLGFRPVDDLQWPAELADQLVTNPDTPRLRHATSLVLDGEDRVDVMPVLVLQQPPDRPQALLHATKTTLVQVEIEDGRPTVPVRASGSLVLYDPFAMPRYLEQLGGNTHYIIHPEEVLADNFAYAAVGRHVSNPGLIERLAHASAREAD